MNLCISMCLMSADSVNYIHCQANLVRELCHMRDVIKPCVHTEGIGYMVCSKSSENSRVLVTT